MSTNCRPTLHLQKRRQRSSTANVLPIRPGLKVINVRQLQQLQQPERGIETELEREIESNTLRDTRPYRADLHEADFHQADFHQANRASAAQPAKRVKRRTKYGFM